MPAFFLILFKINLGLALFAVAYYLILRRLTFYTINRAFLVFGILFSTAYPFIDLSKFFNGQKKIVDLNQQVRNLVPADTIAAYWTWISILFWAGVVIMAIRLIAQFISLHRLHKRSTPGFIGKLPVRLLDESVSPFSFWKNIYINPHLHKETELANILAHENVHVKEWHTLDIILAELSVVFYWFNPGIWLMKKAVKENLEFITDEKVLRKGIDKKSYQYSLLDVGNLQHSAPIVNSFNLPDLKKRIKMMNVKRSSRLTLSRYFLVLPVLLVVTLIFTVSKKEAGKALQPFTETLTDAETAQVETTEHPSSATQQPVKTKNQRPTPKMPKANNTTPIPQASGRENITGPIARSPGISAPADDLNTPPTEPATGIRRVTGISLDSANRVTPNPPAPVADDSKVVTVTGYPTKKSGPKPAEPKEQLKGMPLSNKSDTLSSAPPSAAVKDNAEEKPFRVVTGYKTPRTADKQQN